MTGKKCSRCKNQLSIDNFSRNKRVKDGFSCYCKACTSAINREQYLKNQEQRKEIQRQYNKDNAEILSQKNKAQWADPEWQENYWRNPDNVAHRRAVRRKLMANKRAQDPDHDKKLRERHHAKRLEWERQDRANNPEKYLERGRQQRRQNPHSSLRAGHKYRASLKNNGSIPYSEEQWRGKLEMWGWRCWICKRELPEGYHRDHVKPINKGGMDCLSNLRPACGSCNKSKRDRWPFRPEEEICQAS